MRAVTLLVPRLLDAEMAASAAATDLLPRPRALEAVLARGAQIDFSVDEPPSYEAALCALYGLTRTSAQDLPIAALTRYGDGFTDAEAGWLRADPVHLRPDFGKLLLFDAHGFELARAEADALAQALMQELHDEDLQLALGADPKRWYLRVRGPLPTRTWPAYPLRGLHIDPYLPSGPDARYWQRLINQMQMVLHHASVNSAREQRGELSVNSLWIWGAGRLPDALPRVWTRAFAYDPLAQGLALCTNTPHGAPPDDGQQLVEQLGSDAAVLVIPETDPTRLWQLDRQSWCAYVNRIDKDWIAPLLRGLRRGRLEQLTIATERHRFNVTRRALWRWWRSRVRLDLIKEKPPAKDR
jgi:hypothetical protein